MTCLHAQVMAACLDASADVHAVTVEGYTPLHFACRAASLPAVELLLARGANVNVTSYADGRSPFFLAALSENVPLIRTLLDRGADPSIGDAADMTPLRALRERRATTANTQATRFLEAELSNRFRGALGLAVGAGVGAATAPGMQLPVPVPLPGTLHHPAALPPRGPGFSFLPTSRPLAPLPVSANAAPGVVPVGPQQPGGTPGAHSLTPPIIPRLHSSGVTVGATTHPSSPNPNVLASLAASPDMVFGNLAKQSAVQQLASIASTAAARTGSNDAAADEEDQTETAIPDSGSMAGTFPLPPGFRMCTFEVSEDGVVGFAYPCDGPREAPIRVPKSITLTTAHEALQEVCVCCLGILSLQWIAAAVAVALPFSRSYHITPSLCACVHPLSAVAGGAVAQRRRIRSTAASRE